MHITELMIIVEAFLLLDLVILVVWNMYDLNRKVRRLKKNGGNMDYTKNGIMMSKLTLDVLEAK